VSKLNSIFIESNFRVPAVAHWHMGPGPFLHASCSLRLGAASNLDKDFANRVPFFFPKYHACFQTP
jgi:hypothetical protein